MNKCPFLLVGITEGSPRSRDIPTITSLLANGLDLLYWRTPDNLTDIARLPEAIQSAVLVSARQGSDVPAPCRWHLKESDRQPVELTTETPFSTSIHTLSAWPALAGQVDLVFYSPLFPSISKPGYGPARSLADVGQEVATLRRQHGQLPLLVGLGGIQASNVQQAREAGFDGAALMGALWQSPNPLETLSELQRIIRA